MANKILIESGEFINEVEFIRHISREDGVLYAEFKCKCGKLFITQFAVVRRGDAKSCGCKIIKHGQSPTFLKGAEYRVWQKMKTRCYHKKDPKYSHYGGRGIIVCDRWLKFGNFFEDMGFRPTKRHSIERLDVNGNYCPENCKWVLPAIQSRNKTNSRKFEYNGNIFCSADWIRLLEIPSATFYKRIQNGWGMKQHIDKYEKDHRKKFVVNKKLLPDDSYE